MKTMKPMMYFVGNMAKLLSVWEHSILAMLPCTTLILLVRSTLVRWQSTGVAR
ncbi:hypothetical protein CNR37_00084 [Pseudomonas phage ventosus]|uniref:Uncharacterized protein n=1 Tax=Pseudomonas phage ventosus TaxID=2048980 RepID=A0A2H4P807_9CAUD|nr:hypothetical protein CNR37_00084 [Pseudomonas phage ventosus]